MVRKFSRSTLKLTIIAETTSIFSRSSSIGSETAEVANTSSASPAPAAA